jgi:hypothetical protein
LEQTACAVLESHQMLRGNGDENSRDVDESKPDGSNKIELVGNFIRKGLIH